MEELLLERDSETISGTVEKITFRNEANGYTVSSVKTEKETITVVGMLPFLNEGDSADFTGKFIFHPTYGRQQNPLKEKLLRILQQSLNIYLRERLRVLDLVLQAK